MVFVTETANGKIITWRDSQFFILFPPCSPHVHHPVCARRGTEPWHGLPDAQLPGRLGLDGNRAFSCRSRRPVVGSPWAACRLGS